MIQQTGILSCYCKKKCYLTANFLPDLTLYWCWYFFWKVRANDRKPLVEVLSVPPPNFSKGRYLCTFKVLKSLDSDARDCLDDLTLL